MDRGGSLLTMSYLGAAEVVAHYGVMGPVKAALEATRALPRGRARAARASASTPSPRGRSRRVPPRAFPLSIELLAEARERAPLRQPVELEDVGTYCAFLVSDAAKPSPATPTTSTAASTSLHEVSMTSTFASEDLEVLRNRTFDEIIVGDRASIERTLTAADIQLFAAMSGDVDAAATSMPSPPLDACMASSRTACGAAR